MTRYIGLDVHKHFVQVCVLDHDGRRAWSGKVDCTRPALEQFARQHLTKEDRLALEATTNTWAVVDVLRPFVDAVAVGNPLKTRAIAEAKVKTDKVDAEVLAQLLRCDYLPSVWQPGERTRRLRMLTSWRAALVSDRRRPRNRIHAILAGLLITPPMAGLEWLRAVELPPEARIAMDGELRLIAAIDAEIEAFDRELARLAYDESKVKLLMALPGVNYSVAQTVLGDVSRFADGDHAASYLGLTPSTRESGRKCYQGRSPRPARGTPGGC